MSFGSSSSQAVFFLPHVTRNLSQKHRTVCEARRLKKKEENLWPHLRPNLRVNFFMWVSGCGAESAIFNARWWHFDIFVQLAQAFLQLEDLSSAWHCDSAFAFWDFVKLCEAYCIIDFVIGPFPEPRQSTMALLLLNAICNLLSLGNLILVLLLFFLLYYVKVLYEFRDMPPGPRLTCLPIVGNILSLKTKVDTIAETFERWVCVQVVE